MSYALLNVTLLVKLFTIIYSPKIYNYIHGKSADIFNSNCPRKELRTEIHMTLVSL